MVANLVVVYVLSVERHRSYESEFSAKSPGESLTSLAKYQAAWREILVEPEAIVRPRYRRSGVRTISLGIPLPLVFSEDLAL